MLGHAKKKKSRGRREGFLRQRWTILVSIDREDLLRKGDFRKAYKR